MSIPVKKLQNGFEIPVLGIGTSGMGSGDAEQDKIDLNAIKSAIQLGYTHIDTAEVYANGRAEQLVGEALRDFDRGKMFIASKVAYDNLSYEDLLSSLKATLKRLGTDYLDLYMIHRPNPNISIAETMRALDEAKDKGHIKNIAVSNFTIDQLVKAQSLTKNKIIAGQYHYNLIVREAERKGIVKYLRTNDAMLIAWRPLQKGLLSNSECQIFQQICSKYGKTPSQVALNWLISQNNIVTLVKSTNIDHLKENLGATDWQMELQDIKKLSLEYPDQQNESTLVPLI